MQLQQLAYFELACDFYPFQSRALSHLEHCFQAGQRQLLLLAPPGSGKTLLGLECALRFGLPTLVLTPNTALQHQWVNQFKTFGVPLVDGVNPEEVVGTDPATAPNILCITYQRLASSYRQSSAYRQAENGEPHEENPLYPDLAPYQFVILD